MFDIVSSRDFRAKLKADFDDFMQEPTSSRHALNCIMPQDGHLMSQGDELKLQ